MADESEIALAVMRIASAQRNDVATFSRAKKEVPNLVNLDRQNLALSQTRRGEPMWYQLIRNIQSHHDTDGNFIQLGYLEHVPRLGYKITKSGKARLKSLGY